MLVYQRVNQNKSGDLPVICMKKTRKFNEKLGSFDVPQLQAAHRGAGLSLLPEHHPKNDMVEHYPSKLEPLSLSSL